MSGSVYLSFCCHTDWLIGLWRHVVKKKITTRRQTTNEVGASSSVTAKETICKAKHWLLGQKWGQTSPVYPHELGNFLWTWDLFMLNCNYSWNTFVCTSNQIWLLQIISLLHFLILWKLRHFVHTSDLTTSNHPTPERLPFRLKVIEILTLQPLEQ